MTPRPVVAVAAGLCLGVVTVGCTDAGASRHASHETAATTSVAPTRSAPLADPQPRVVTLAFAGDTHFQLNLSSLLDHPHDALGAIRGTLADADLTMLNLESAITERGSRDPKELETRPTGSGTEPPPRARPAGRGRRGRGHGGEQPRRRLRTGGARRHPPRRRPRPDPGGRGGTRPRGGLHAVPRRRSTAPGSPSSPPTPPPARGAAASGRPAEALPGSPPPAARTPTPCSAAVRRAAARDEVVAVYLHWGVEGHACPAGAG